MGEHTDKVTGKVKQAVGDLTDDEDLQHEGERDELAGKAKGLVADLKKKAEDTIDAAKEKLDEVRNHD